MLKKFIALFFIIILSACNNQTQDLNLTPSDFISSSGQINILNLSMHPPKDFNPFKNQDITVDNIFRLMFEPLIKINSDGSIKNNLISQINFLNQDLNKNKFKAIINLREDIFWSDNTNLNSDDIIFSLDQIKNFNSIYKYLTEEIISYKKLSSHSLEIIFKNGAYISIYLLNFPVIPKKFFSQTYSQDNLDMLITNGAYKFLSYTRMKDMQLEVNPNYFDTPPNIKHINILITPDQESAFNQNLTDLILINPDDLGKFHSGLKIIPHATNEIEFIFLNPATNLFSTKTLRDIIINLIPIQDIKTKIYSNNLGESILETQINLNHTTQILEDYKPLDSLRIITNQENMQRRKTADLIQKELNTESIDSIIYKKSFEAYLSSIQNKNYDILIGGFNLADKPDYTKLLGENNLLDYNDENILEILNQIKLAQDFQELNTKLIKLGEQIQKKSYLIILGVKNKLFLLNKNISSQDMSFFNFR